MSDAEIVPNVITEHSLRQRLEEGSELNIHCINAPYRKGPNWHGLWKMDAVHPSGTKQTLVTARATAATGGVKVREFKTISGVVSFLVGCGFDAVSFPVSAGEKVSLSLQRVQM